MGKKIGIGLEERERQHGQHVQWLREDFFSTYVLLGIHFYPNITKKLFLFKSP